MPTVPTRRRFAARRWWGALVLTLTCLALTAACGSSTNDTATSTSATASVTTSPAPRGDLPEVLQTSLQQALDQTMATYDVPGGVVGVWIPGKGAWIGAAGVADRETNAPVSGDMIWPLRSVTKSFTVTLILQLADEGKLSLDDPLDKYVSGVTDGSSITLRQLADMSSGNADYTNDAFITDFQADPNKIFTIDELNSYVLDQPADFTPGTERIYTNANTNLLGAVVEKVTGQPFSDVLNERVIRPLGLEHTQYLVDATQWPDPHAIGYQPDAGVLTPQPDNLSIYGPAGSMVSNLDDERVWAEALATGSLLTSAMQSERIQGAPLQKGPPYDQYALGIGETDGWWGHNGEGFGFTTAAFHNNSTGATVVVFMNEAQAVPEGHPADQMFRRVAEILQPS
ncbi:MAG TPA: serine hydrolase domain-containing protein [Nocardioidaceae bacterium]|nr:serine hydrolase domain-containing protein [Nocardioidaceae bacterium]